MTSCGSPTVSPSCSRRLTTRKTKSLLNGVGGQGSAVYGKKDFANISLFDDVIDNSGLANFSSIELGKALAGKIANAHLTMNERRMGISGNRYTERRGDNAAAHLPLLHQHP